jgi:hypothetical protein
VTAGRTGEASADPADPSFFIDINKVPAGNNVNAALQKKGAQGSFTVDCGVRWLMKNQGWASDIEVH